MDVFRPLKRLKHSCEMCIKDVIYNRRHDAKARRLGVIFRLLSYLFYSVVFFRKKAYSHRWLRGQHVGCSVIVVGNLTVGGTGKTPVVEKLARWLQIKGRKVAVLSRGYKSKKESILKKIWHWMFHIESYPPKIVSDGKNCLLPYEKAGDEPLLLAKNLPGVCVVVDKDRVKAGQYAIQHLKCDTLILDDGFQYFQLKGTLYILLMDATYPFGNGHVLPRGILREPLKNMQRAHCILLTKSDQVMPTKLKALERFVRRYNKTAPIYPCIHSPKHLKAVFDTTILPLTELRGRRLAAISGIASPKSFENFLKQQGATLVYREHFLDHYHYSKEDLVGFFAKAKEAEAEWVITTEKDAVRLNFMPELNLPFFFLRMEVEWVGKMDPLQNIFAKLLSI